MDEAAAFAGHVVPAKSDRFFAAPAVRARRLRPPGAIAFSGSRAGVPIRVPLQNQS